MNLLAVIMAGGSGTRFWPLSRASRPKQFLPIASERTMIEETVERLLPLIPIESIYTISSASQAEIIRSLLPGLPTENCLLEPEGRNTAPSLILATASLFLRKPEAVIAALPSDHVILKPEIFRKKLEAAAVAAARGFLVTFGIPPTYPATGYGYIHYDHETSFSFLNEIFYPVFSFKEKPSRKQAEAFLQAGHYYWNSGMFLWRADILPAKLQAHAPEWFLYWEKILEGVKNGNDLLLASIFREMPVLSIDYALMEKAKGVLVCPGDFAWSDVGVWSSLPELWPNDESCNASRGEIISLNSERNLIYNPQRLTAIIGVKDLIIVNTEDALLICHREADQKIKEIIEWLKKKDKIEYL